MIAPQDVRELILDKIENNYLLDGEELSDVQIMLAQEMVLADWNSTPPTDAQTLQTFPYKHVLMFGTLGRCFMGQAALRARNTFQFSDGGIAVPLEERFAMYQSLGSMYMQEYQSAMSKIKISINMDQGWGSISSDYSNFPIW